MISEAKQTSQTQTKFNSSLKNAPTRDSGCSKSHLTKTPCCKCNSEKSQCNNCQCKRENKKCTNCKPMPNGKCSTHKNIRIETKSAHSRVPTPFDAKNMDFLDQSSPISEPFEPYIDASTISFVDIKRKKACSETLKKQLWKSSGW